MDSATKSSADSARKASRRCINDLSDIAKEKIAEREIERLKEDYDIEDRELFDKIKKGAVTQSNAREIKHLIKDTFSLVALKKICGETEI